jgi:hypothetical protein
MAKKFRRVVEGSEDLQLYLMAIGTALCCILGTVGVLKDIWWLYYPFSLLGGGGLTILLIEVMVNIEERKVYWKEV